MNLATKMFAGLWKMSSGVPICSTLPERMMTTRSASVIASTWSWVT